VRAAAADRRRAWRTAPNGGVRHSCSTRDVQLFTWAPRCTPEMRVASIGARNLHCPLDRPGGGLVNKLYMTLCTAQPSLDVCLGVR
jgi:hypothetical protein